MEKVTVHISRNRDLFDETKNEENKIVDFEVKSMKDLVRKIIDESGDDWDLDNFYLFFCKGGHNTGKTLETATFFSV